MEAMTTLATELACWADIGAGDLEWARSMLQAGRAEHMVCVEKAAGAFERARVRARTDGRITLLQGDGFSPLLASGIDPSGVGLAGMGGRTIREILLGGIAQGACPTYLLLAPAADADLAITAALALGYTVLRWRWVPEGSRLRLVVMLGNQLAVAGAGAVSGPAALGRATKIPAGPRSRGEESETEPRPWWRLAGSRDPLTARAVCDARRMEQGVSKMRAP